MADVVIAGAGIVGTATAVQVLTADPTLDVVLVEPDWTYALAATGKGTGGVRQLFTRPENIRLSQATLDVIEAWDTWAGADGYVPPALNWRANGYLFIAGEADADALHLNYDVQRTTDVPVEWLDPAELAQRYPEMRSDDLYGAVLSTRDGWLNPRAFFEGVRDKAVRLGARRMTDRVVGFDRHGTTVRAVHLASGEMIRADAFVNAAGTWAPALASQLDMPLPVEPMRRHEHYVETANDLRRLPFIKDVHGLAIHSHLNGLSIGLVDFDHPAGEDFTVDTADWRSALPALADRLPGAGTLTRRDTWTGLYDQNRLDGNAIVGNWPGHLDNFYVASGFSGHGFMQALGVGNALTEQILHGEYRTIDLERFAYQRVPDNRPYPEVGIR